MLVIKNLSLKTKQDGRLLLDNFNFSLAEGRQKTALIGEEGNGKSTLLKCIATPEALSSYLEISGEINRQGERIGYLAQQLEPADLEQSTSAYFTAALSWADLDYAKYYRLLAEWDFPENRICPELKLGQLSGGEKIKLQLLRLLLQEPTLLLLDEPSNDLDLSSLSWFEEFLRQQQLPLIFISHDEELLENCADSVIHLEQLQRKRRPVYTVSGLSYKQYVLEREHNISKQTQLARKDKAEFDAQMERYQQIYERVKHEQATVSRQDPGAGKNLKDKMHSVKSMGLRFERQKENLRSKPDFEKEIELFFAPDLALPARKKVLDLQLPELKAGECVLSRNVCLSIFGPEKICIVGQNGCGKTTLLRLIRAELSKQNIVCGYMPQEFSELLPAHCTAVEFLTQGPTKEEHTRIRSYLGSIRFTPEEMFYPVSALSGGQRAKLFFAKMILERCEFLILDEPSRNLSPLSAPEIRQALRDFRGGIIAVSHERKFLREVCNKIYRLDENGLSLTEAEAYIAASQG